MKTLPVLCCGPATEPLDSAASETLAARFRALSDPTRVAIVNRLASTQECCVCDLNEAFDLSQPTISHHLKVLRAAGPGRTTGSCPTPCASCGTRSAHERPLRLRRERGPLADCAGPLRAPRR